ncbi:hypothetical protein [Xanthobacter sp. VNH20]|uniref:hypothetical protein n=1 Tax=Xanthobacter sp. VNH20 TaxID=3156616 RepID=UPI0032B3AADE
MGLLASRGEALEKILVSGPRDFAEPTVSFEQRVHAVSSLRANGAQKSVLRQRSSVPQRDTEGLSGKGRERTPQSLRLSSREQNLRGVKTMRGFVLWLLGVPFSVIVLLYLFNVL